jgi:large subunit ribosomal protein L10
MEGTVERNQKEAFIASLRSSLETTSLVVVTRQSGLTVTEVQALRGKIRDAGATYRVGKNTLTRIALEGTPNEALSSYLKGPTALACSSDPVAAAKATVEFANTNDKLEVVCGVLNGQFLDAAAVKALATLPSLDELRGKIIGLVQAPAGKIARILQEPASQLARVFAAYADK